MHLNQIIKTYSDHVSNKSCCITCSKGHHYIHGVQWLCYLMLSHPMIDSGEDIEC